MESIMARALEYTLKYWFKSFTRDQFKLQGRTVQLSNLAKCVEVEEFCAILIRNFVFEDISDISGDALHASLGLPPALTVSMAKSGKLEIVLPYLSNVQIMPIVVQIDKLDLVLEENDDVDSRRSTNSAQAPSNSSKSSGYGFAEKIADGMTLQIQTVNLLLETHGGGRHLRGVTWASPMASITIRNLVLYTTNENWQVVNLKAAREFSCDKNFIYVFRVIHL
ncbi:putative UHRF1-binding protein [Helianthus anomalus]